jgi:hypothetical protein
MSISLVLISNVNHVLCEFSLKKTLENICPDEILIFSDRRLNIGRHYKFVELPSKFGIIEYSVFCLKKLVDHIETDYVLIVQPDGMAGRRDYWSDEFFNYDYIGAPNSTRGHEIEKILIEDCGVEDYRGWGRWILQNGGFSLRSKKLLLALQDERIKDYFLNQKTGQYLFGEDIQISIINRRILEQDHGIKFAPTDVALNFSTEKLCSSGESFGFHGWQNIPWFLTQEECIFYIDNLQPNHDQYRLNRLSGFLFENRYYRAMERLNHLRNQWGSY